MRWVWTHSTLVSRLWKKLWKTEGSSIQSRPEMSHLFFLPLFEQCLPGWNAERFGPEATHAQSRVLKKWREQLSWCSARWYRNKWESTGTVYMLSPLWHMWLNSFVSLSYFCVIQNPGSRWGSLCRFKGEAKNEEKLGSNEQCECSKNERGEWCSPILNYGQSLGDSIEPVCWKNRTKVTFTINPSRVCSLCTRSNNMSHKIDPSMRDGDLIALSLRLISAPVSHFCR